jgi:Fic family protein
MIFTEPTLDAREVEVASTIDELRERLGRQLHQPRRWVGNLRRLSLARAIQGSNSIEGFVASLEDVAAVDAGEDPADVDPETGLALRGYREAMTYVLQLSVDERFEYSEQLLKSLHFMMTSYDLATRPGRWRAGPIYVHDGRTSDIVYEGPEVDRVPDLMAELVAWLREGSASPAIVRAGMAHLDLAMIHPFRDGNGRMARCLQTLVLARDGVLEPEFCSIEEYLGRNTEDYYLVLRQVGRGAWHPENDARPWVRLVLTAHYRQAQTLLHRVRESEQLWVALEQIARTEGLRERSLDALFEAAQGLRIRRATYQRLAGEALGEQTAGRDLRELAERGLLVPHGEKRGRHYTGSERLLETWRRIRSRRPAVEDDPFGG